MTVQHKATRRDILRQAKAWLVQESGGQRIPSSDITRAYRPLNQWTHLRYPFASWGAVQRGRC